MDANALKKLARSDIQRLAQRENLRKNAKTKAIIDQLVKKYPEGVPTLQPPAIQTSISKRTTAESPKTRVENEGDLSETGGEVATRTKPTMNRSKITEDGKTDVVIRPLSMADSALMSAVKPHIETESTKPGRSDDSERATMEANATSPSGVATRGVFTTTNLVVASTEDHRANTSNRTYRVSSASGARGRAEPSSDNPLYSTSSPSVPDRVTPSQSEGDGYPREARIKELLRKIAEKTKEANYWGQVLADANATLENARTETEKLNQQRRELEKRRKVAERCLMTWKAQHTNKDTKEVSDEAPSSDFVATSDSSVEGETSAMKDLRAVCAGKKTYFGKQRMASDSE